MVQNVVLVFLRRRLSQRPNVEELESRNILKRKFNHVSKLPILYVVAPYMCKKRKQTTLIIIIIIARIVQCGSLFRSKRTHECTFLLFTVKAGGK